VRLRCLFSGNPVLGQNRRCCVAVHFRSYGSPEASAVPKSSELGSNKMTKKVLCALDDTEHSKSAVALAAELAKATGAELTILAVNVPVGGEGRGGIAVYAWENSDLKRVLDIGTAIAKKAGISEPKTASVKSRDAARAIVVYAEDNDIDHIVVGTGGKGGVARLMLGSVSRDVIARAHCPVTVAR
jgi:nucleotide-binding universal stress UspA family protein